MASSSTVTMPSSSSSLSSSMPSSSSSSLSSLSSSSAQTESTNVSSLLKDWNPQIVADFCLTPLGTSSASESKEISIAVQVLSSFKNLQFSMHANGTNIQGSYDEITQAVKEVHRVLHNKGIVGISTLLKFVTRTDKEQTIQQKVESVTSKLTQQ